MLHARNGNTASGLHLTVRNVILDLKIFTNSLDLYNRVTWFEPGYPTFENGKSFTSHLAIRAIENEMCHIILEPVYRYLSDACCWNSQNHGKTN